MKVTIDILNKKPVQDKNPSRAAAEAKNQTFAALHTCGYEISNVTDVKATSVWVQEENGARSRRRSTQVTLDMPDMDELNNVIEHIKSNMGMGTVDISIVPGSIKEENEKENELDFDMEAMCI
jgi:hypothetical protein